MALQPAYASRFNKDVGLAKRRGKDIAELKKVNGTRSGYGDHVGAR